MLSRCERLVYRLYTTILHRHSHAYEVRLPWLEPFGPLRLWLQKYLRRDKFCWPKGFAAVEYTQIFVFARTTTMVTYTTRRQTYVVRENGHKARQDHPLTSRR